MSVGPLHNLPTPEGASRVEGSLGSETLQEGLIVVGKVVQLRSEGVLVQVGGRLLALTAAMSLVVGRQVPLLVKEGGQQPVLVPMPSLKRDGSGVCVSDSDLARVLRSFGLPVDDPHREALRRVLAGGYPVTADVIRRLTSGPSTSPSTGLREEATDPALARLMESLDLSADDLHLSAARQLLARGLPLTRENVEQLVRTLVRLGATGEEDFQAAVCLRASNLPITASTLELVKATLRAPIDLGRKVHNLRGVLAAVSDALESAPPAEDDPAGRDVQQLVERAAQQLSRRIVSAEGDDRSRLVDSLQRLFKDQGTSLESWLARVLAGEADLAELEGDFRVLLGRLAEAARSAGSLSHELPELRQNLALLREAVPELADGLLAQQFRNAAEPSAGAERWLSFQLPLADQLGERPRTAELRIGRNPAGGIDPDRVRLVLRLELERLRTVEVRLQIVGKQATCGLASDCEGTLPVLKEHFGSLLQALEGLGYVVARPTFSLLGEGGEPSAPTAAVPDSLPRVDFRA